MQYIDGWSIFTDIRKDARRMGIKFEKSTCKFRLYDNTKFQLCETYPAYLIVPATLSDEHIIACSKFRTKNRLPALSYYHKANGVSMWRSSQNMNGVLNYRSMEDEIMITEIGKTANRSSNMINNSRVIIYDARPKLNAQGNKFKGGGFEDLKNYKNCDLIFCDIDRI